MAQKRRRSCCREQQSSICYSHWGEWRDVLRGVVEYNTDLFSTQRVQRLIGHYEQLLNAIVNNPQQRVSELPLLTETEQQLLQGFNDTVRALPQDLCAHQLFEEQVARTPEAVALIAEDEQLSYAELNGRANQLAHYLRRSGVGVETVVGVCLPTRCQPAGGAAGSAQERRCLPAAGARLRQRQHAGRRAPRWCSPRPGWRRVCRRECANWCLKPCSPSGPTAHE